MSTFTRRAALAAPFFLKNLLSAPPSDRVRLASMGAEGMAWATLHGIATHPNVELICVAEVDKERTGRVQKTYPKAALHQDWRKMLDTNYKNLDAICVGTPDHMHAPQTMAAMRRGLDVYCQKPLTSHVHEARQVTKYAAAHKRVTQMGIQIHSYAEYQIAVELVHQGAIGKVKEVHAWSNKKWGDTAQRPDQTDPIPASLDWDSWVGVGRMESYIKDYCHPGNWRKRLEFGTGTFGDMGCHVYDPVFGALGLTAPSTVRSEGPEPNQNSWAVNAIVKYTFPATQYSEAGKPVRVTWYDGDEKPAQEILDLVEDSRMSGTGSIVIGTKGVLYIPHFSMPSLHPKTAFVDFKFPEFKRKDHYHEFVEAIQGKTKTSTSFDYSGPLSETVLLGSVATRFPKTTLEWDSARLRFKNVKEANQYLKRPYRTGWKVKGLG